MIKGDVCESLPKFLSANPEPVVSLLYLDADLYSATKCALDLVLPRMPKRSVVVFDELGMRDYPGETIAALEILNFNQTNIRKLPSLKASYFVV